MYYFSEYLTGVSMNTRLGKPSRYSASPRRGDEVKREKLGEWGMEITKGLESQEFRSNEINQDHLHSALNAGRVDADAYYCTLRSLLYLLRTYLNSHQIRRRQCPRSTKSEHVDH